MEKENLMKKMLVILCSLFSITIFACRDEDSPSNSKSSSSSSYSKKSSNSKSSSSSSYSTDQRMSFEEIFTANIIRGAFQRAREPANMYGFGLSPLNTNHSLAWNVKEDGRKHEERFSLLSSSSSSSRSNSFRNNSFSPSSSYSWGSSGSDASNFAYKAKPPSGIDLCPTSFSSSWTSSSSSSYSMRGGLAGEGHGYIMPNQHVNQVLLSKPKQLHPKVENKYDAKGELTNVRGDGRYTIDGKVSTSVEGSCYKLNDPKKKGIPTAMCYQSRQNTYELLNSEFPHIPTFGFAAPFGHNVRSKSFLVGVGDSLGSLSRSISSFPSISLGKFSKLNTCKLVDKSLCYRLLSSPLDLGSFLHPLDCYYKPPHVLLDFNDLPLGLALGLLPRPISSSPLTSSRRSSRSTIASRTFKDQKCIVELSRAKVENRDDHRDSGCYKRKMDRKVASSNVAQPHNIVYCTPLNSTSPSSSSRRSSRSSGDRTLCQASCEQNETLFHGGSLRSNTSNNRSFLNTLADKIKSLLHRFGSSTSSTSSPSLISSSSSSGSKDSGSSSTSLCHRSP